MSTMPVLVVEDDANLPSVLRAAMQRKGCEIEEACEGAEALSQIGGKAFDAAIVDYHLPPPDGLEVLRQLRAAQPRRVRVLMFGALDLPVVMAAVNRGEVMRLVAKPFHLDALFSALEEALTERARLEETYGRAHQEVLERQRRELESCFSHQLLQLVVQPLVDAASGAIEGYEGLLRSRRRSLNSPASVIAAAKAQGMLRRLADQVAAAAADRLGHLPPYLTLFINAHPGAGD